jgi:hypothetical protein
VLSKIPPTPFMLVCKNRLFVAAAMVLMVRSLYYRSYGILLFSPLLNHLFANVSIHILLSLLRYFCHDGTNWKTRLRNYAI